MRAARTLGPLLVAVSAFAGSLYAEDADAILGLWATEVTENGYSHVSVTKEGGLYSGEIVWLSQPVFPDDDSQGMAGKPKVDRENPDPARQHDPVIGLRLMGGFEFAGDGRWVGGTIYDPENGKTYKCKVQLADDGSLKVRGFIGISLIGRTTLWVRPEAEVDQGSAGNESLPPAGSDQGNRR